MKLALETRTPAAEKPIKKTHDLMGAFSLRYTKVNKKGLSKKYGQLIFLKTNQKSSDKIKV
jgi:hypothetical protein